jgi:tetratricopeptide (TPR) repeat protein
MLPLLLRAPRPALAAICLLLASCGPPLSYVAPAPAPAAAPATRVPPSIAPPPAAVAADADAVSPGAGPARPPLRIARVQPLGAAASTLVREARAQSARGEFALAAATLERAMRIEPDHPRLWIELGLVREAAHNYTQAEVMGRKALAVADDHATQALAWRLIAASLKAQGRAPQAAEAAETARRLDPES